MPMAILLVGASVIFKFMYAYRPIGSEQIGLLNAIVVFLSGAGQGSEVVTVRLMNMAGTRGTDWHLLTAGAFISMILPLGVFLSLQRFFVKGLLAGSVKG